MLDAVCVFLWLAGIPGFCIAIAFLTLYNK